MKSSTSKPSVNSRPPQIFILVCILVAIMAGAAAVTAVCVHHNSSVTSASEASDAERTKGYSLPHFTPVVRAAGM